MLLGFLSNYPVSEGVAAEISRIGREAEIDVSWRGPDYFEAALTRQSQIAAAFPGLQVNALSEQLARIEQGLSDSSGNGAPEVLYAGPPRTTGEQEDLLRRRPPAWEYLLFGGVLLQRRAALEAKWRDHELRLPRRSRHKLSKDEVSSHLSDALGSLGSIVEPMTRLFDAQQSAFGEPGEPGDAVRIEHFATWLMNAYEDMLDWGAELRSLDTAPELKRAIELAAMAADRPLNEVRAFVDRVISGTEAIPEHLAKPKADQEAAPLAIEATLEVTIDSALMSETLSELRRALGLPEDLD